MTWMKMKVEMIKKKEEESVVRGETEKKGTRRRKELDKGAEEGRRPQDDRRGAFTRMPRFHPPTHPPRTPSPDQE